MREPEVLHAAFNFHPELCTGCGACVAACMDEHSDFTRCPRRLCQKEKRTRTGWRVVWYSVACLHCQDAPCAAVCPRDCLTVDGETGTVQLDRNACIGCGACVRRCAYGGIALQKDGKADKCDGCAERLREGLPPRCVAACPQQALTIDDRPALREQCREALKKALNR